VKSLSDEKMATLLRRLFVDPAAPVSVETGSPSVRAASAL
jgi:hypothetical protein